MADNKDSDFTRTEESQDTQTFLADYDRPERSSRLLFKALAITIFIVTIIVAGQIRIIIKSAGSRRINPILSNYVKQSKQLRFEVAREYQGRNSTPAPSTVIPHKVLFDERQYALIEQASNEVLNDPQIRDSFPSTYDGIPLEQTSAIVVPLWKLNDHGDRQQMGITEAGYLRAKEDFDHNPDGLTIREKPIDSMMLHELNLKMPKCPKTKNGTPRTTEDGIPRIGLRSEIINSNSYKRLKLTLLHEFVHAHDVPGYSPWFNLVHSDLTYLAGYNAMMDKLDWEYRVRDYAFWFLTGFGLVMTARYSYLATRRNRS
ncbi:MAG TPA: hypothetical protein VJS44_18445 [Pyrinomonadaceae bacterium]|nr:hypothetical protein [Pyrinomonadaceae bacterium]